jgi:hypothetical protein
MSGRGRRAAEAFDDAVERRKAAHRTDGGERRRSGDGGKADASRVLHGDGFETREHFISRNGAPENEQLARQAF